MQKKEDIEMTFPWPIEITSIRSRRGRGPPKVIVHERRNGTGGYNEKNSFSSSTESSLEEDLTFDIHKYEETEP